MNSSSTNKLSVFFKEVATEVKKVSWPTRREVLNYTLIVIGASVAVGAFLGGLDKLFQILLSYALQYLPR
ncbi:MAG: preprotein translocase subunit SecE [Candidatus Paceibacterota bacterium]|jgi:preprotein translocase subunit SecE